MAEPVPHQFDLNIPIVLSGTQIDAADQTVHMSFTLHGFSVIGRVDPTVNITLTQDAVRRTNPRSMVMHIRQHILQALADALQLQHEAPAMETTDE